MNIIDKDIKKDIKKAKLQLLAKGNLSSLTIKAETYFSLVLHVMGTFKNDDTCFNFFITYHDIDSSESMIHKLNRKISEYEHY